MTTKEFYNNVNNSTDVEYLQKLLDFEKSINNYAGYRFKTLERKIKKLTCEYASTARHIVHSVIPNTTDLATLQLLLQQEQRYKKPRLYIIKHLQYRISALSKIAEKNKK